ncbi:MAG TPA: nucleoside hydrolase [Aggregatilineales bacterium]|nr:nucleoside hydrolase [Aggregatilineales bacterium]
MTIKVIHDTDIGSDIDDAVCLAYLLAQPECELVGVTTVTGEVEKRAMLASALVRASGKDVPVYPGAAAPLLVPQKQPFAPQAEALAGWDHQEQFPAGEAIEFLRYSIRQHPGEIVLLTTGPLTNAALLFKVDPEIPSLLRSLVMMCGVMKDDTLSRRGSLNLEWNAICDPHATAIVYRADVQVHRSVGLQVTQRVKMPADQVREKFRSFRNPPHQLLPVLDFAEIWFRDNPEITFHDPLAGATIFDERICRFSRGQIEVELGQEDALGATLWTPSESAGPHQVAFDVDTVRFFEHFASAFA